MADIYYGEDQTVKVYKWAEKEVADGVPNGVLTDFTIDNSAVAVTEIDSDLLPDHIIADANGEHSFYKYAAGWSTDTGRVALRDFAVYFRKSGVDTKVDDAVVSLTGTTLSFTQAPTSAVADSIVVSYGYNDSEAPEDYTFQVKDFDFTAGDRDIDSENALGNKVYYRKTPQALKEMSLTTIKKDVSLSQMVNGELVKTTTEVSGRTIRTTVGSSTRKARALIVTSTDATNTDVKLKAYARNVIAVTVEHTGGADASLEETISFKCSPNDYAEIEIQ